MQTVSWFWRLTESIFLPYYPQIQATFEQIFQKMRLSGNCFGIFCSTFWGSLEQLAVLHNHRESFQRFTVYMFYVPHPNCLRPIMTRTIQQGRVYIKPLSCFSYILGNRVTYLFSEKFKAVISRIFITLVFFSTLNWKLSPRQKLTNLYLVIEIVFPFA